MSFAHNIIESIWQRQSLWSKIGWAALAPCSFAFSFIVRGRNLLYDLHLLPIAQVPLNVISIGNLTVGGTGKTPFTLWLAHSLQQRGHQVGILTRGYKGTEVGPTLVGRDGTPLAPPATVGDEAVMLARRFAGVVIAGRDRIAAALLAREQFGLDVVILDDGFQHRRLYRDVDVLLVAAQQQTHDWLLPAGPLREPFTAVSRAHIVVYTKSAGNHSEAAPQPIGQCYAPALPLFCSDFVPTVLIHSHQGRWEELPLSLLAGKRVVAVTGIATPAPFLSMIRQQGAEIVNVMEFPDHHRYTEMDWQEIVQKSQSCDLVITTEKDLVKLEQFSSTATQVVALRGEMRIDPAEAFLTAIEQRLRYKSGDRTD